jgi:transposase
MARLFWLSVGAWAQIEPHLPHGQLGKPRVDDRRVISGIPHVLEVGCRWPDTPSAYGPHTMIYTRYNRWSQRGVWQRLFAKIATAGPVPDEVKLDASHVKAHRSAAGGTGGPGARRSAARAACSRAKSIAWPMVVADRLRSPSGPATWPTSPCRCLSCGPWCRPSA